MREFFKRLKTVSLVEALVCVIVGFLMIFCTDFTRETLIYLFAGLFIVVGIIKIIDYFMYGFEPFGFILGIVDILVGIIFVANTQSILNSNIIGMLLGAILIIKSLFTIQESFDLRRMGAKKWWIDLLLSVVVIVFAVFILFSPNADRLIFQLSGTAIMISGILVFIDVFVVSAKVKKTRKTLKDVFKKDDDNIIDI